MSGYWVTGVGERLSVAVTVLVVVSVKMHPGVVPVQAPPQLLKLLFVSGVSISEIDVSVGASKPQDPSVPQVMPADDVDGAVPLSIPVLVIVRVAEVAGGDVVEVPLSKPLPQATKRNGRHKMNTKKLNPLEPV
ncbi:MAG TPA: hypothetical protein VJ760_03615 [Nitrospiraceae bacterium]|nr:hypothetical protein [Nitrospiraceae bacterium]